MSAPPRTAQVEDVRGRGSRRFFLLAMLFQLLVLCGLVLREERAITGGRTIFLEVNRANVNLARPDRFFRPNLTLRNHSLGNLVHDPQDLSLAPSSFRNNMWLRLEPALPCWRPVELRRSAPQEDRGELWLRVRVTMGISRVSGQGAGRGSWGDGEIVAIDPALRLFYRPSSLPGRRLDDEEFPEDGPPLSVRISVSADGRGTVQDLLVGELSWDEWISGQQR